ncbi:SUMF1/EgtB/PvdO family nonheme iron enzyme [Hahella sp. SMD15-11]|uniref:SUMF1/EgtB/PvdO family nonheme iron enzyme n=1 Tax=Thermohahella caldifontis TaxID=3142973 RepID=A0AB39UUP5_9GAMM
MSGNAAEWVLDWYDPDYYAHSPENNPKGPSDGMKKILRGGSYLASPSGSNVFVREEQNFGSWQQDFPGTGFRCAISSPERIAN